VYVPRYLRDVICLHLSRYLNCRFMNEALSEDSPLGSRSDNGLNKSLLCCKFLYMVQSRRCYLQSTYRFQSRME
jgi:hypothetical protein